MVAPPGPRVAIVLPPKEGFSPRSVGAVGMLVHRLARAAGGDVVGRAVDDPFDDVGFHPATPGWGMSDLARYAAGAARELRALGPDLVEVHNRPEVALRLARRFPRVLLFLHNEPSGMRGSSSARERAALLRKLAGVVTVSDYLRKRFLEGVQGEVSVLPNSVDVPPVLHRIRQRLILFVGRTVEDKGADAFVEACAAVLPRLPGWRAEMVGADRFSPDSPSTPFLERLVPRAAQVGVTMRGYEPNAQVTARLGPRDDRGGAEPLAGAVRPDRARGDGVRRGAGLLRGGVACRRWRATAAVYDRSRRVRREIAAAILRPGRGSRHVPPRHDGRRPRPRPSVRRPRECRLAGPPPRRNASPSY